MKVRVEQSFLSSLNALSIHDQKLCLRSIKNYVSTGSGSHNVADSKRRRLKFLFVSSGLRVVFGTTDSWINTPRSPAIVRWVWAGLLNGLSAACQKIDGAKIDDTEELDVESKLLELDGVDTSTIYSECEEPAVVELTLPPATTTEILKLADGIATYTDGIESLCHSIKKKHESLIGSMSTSLNKGILDDLNAMRAERDRLFKELKLAKKHVDLAQAETASVKKLSEDLKATKVMAARLANDLEKAKATDRVAMAAAFSLEDKERLVFKCAQVLEDRANLLMKLGSPRDQARAEDLRDEAKNLRAMKL